MGRRADAALRDGFLGAQEHITNPTDQLAGIWVDDTSDASTLAGPNSSNPPGPTNTYTDLAAEAQRAVAHFGITDLANSNIIIAQPPKLQRPERAVVGLLRLPRLHAA